MKNIMIILLCLFFLLSAPLAGEMLCEIGTEHENSLQLIKGEWFIRESGAFFNFTGNFARKLYGLKYFRYHTSKNFRNKIYLFTIVKSDKTGRLYFARGEYKNGQFFNSTSRIRFRGKNNFVVYSRDSHRQILYEAVRIVKKEVAAKAGSRKIASSD